jgi:hypothetical protein
VLASIIAPQDELLPILKVCPGINGSPRKEKLRANGLLKENQLFPPLMRKSLPLLA